MSLEQSNRFIKYAMILCGLGALALGIFVSSNQSIDAPPTISGTFLPEARPMPETPLQFANIGSKSIQHLKGKWSLVFFGYTHCPDVCPMTLTTIKQALKTMPDPNIVNVLFISVDPHRDTPEILEKYMGYFDSRYFAATASLATLEQISKHFYTVFHTPSAPTEEHYNVDHSSAILVLNPNAEFQAVLSAPHTIESLQADIKALTLQP